MPLRRPRKGEKQNECVRELSAEGASERSPEQKLAICFRAWRDRHRRKDADSAREELQDLLDRAADFAAKARYDHGQPRAQESGRWVGHPDDTFPTAFAQHHHCPRCGFRWSTTRRAYKR